MAARRGLEPSRHGGVEIQDCHQGPVGIHGTVAHHGTARFDVLQNVGAALEVLLRVRMEPFEEPHALAEGTPLAPAGDANLRIRSEQPLGAHELDETRWGQLLVRKRSEGGKSYMTHQEQVSQLKTIGRIRVVTFVI